MTSIRHVIRSMTALLVLGLTVGLAGAAFGMRVAPQAGGNASSGAAPVPAPLQGGSPLWEFLAVAAGAVLVTLVAVGLITHARHAPGHHPSHA